MKTSICLATRNKAALLRKTLASIRRQQVPFEYEVIVADDGSTDDTSAICREYGVRYLFLDNDRYRNPARARNDAYRVATGEVIIAQSDDVVHATPNTIEQLTNRLNPNAVIMATVENRKADGTECRDPFFYYSGPKQPRAFFFLGAMWRSDLYEIGGNHEGFVEPCWDDNWFQDCLLIGRKLRLEYAPDVIGHHQAHSFPAHSHDRANLSKLLYRDLRQSAEASGLYVSPGSPWPMEWPVIPKQMSFFWGGQRLSWLRYMTLASFRHYHPAWRMNLYRMTESARSEWTSYEIEDAASYEGLDYSDRLADLGVTVIPWQCPIERLSATHASDLCQWEILSTVGGMYSDMDILYTNPMPEEARQADATFCLSNGYMTIGFFGATPGSPLFAEIAHTARNNYSTKRYQSTGAEAIYRMAGLGASWDRHDAPGRKCVNYLRDRYPQLRIRELCQESVYPFTCDQVPSIFEETATVPAATFGIHWFGGNPLAQKWNQRLTPKNYKTTPCVLTPYIVNASERARCVLAQPDPSIAVDWAGCTEEAKEVA